MLYDDDVDNANDGGHCSFAAHGWLVVCIILVRHYVCRLRVNHSSVAAVLIEGGKGLVQYAYHPQTTQSFLELFDVIKRGVA